MRIPLALRLAVYGTILLAIGRATGQELPKPTFYLPLDGSTVAAIAGGSSTPQFGGQPDSILTLVDRTQQRFAPGKVGQCHDMGSMPLIFRCDGNFHPDEGTASFWLNPHFRGDDKNIYCTFFGAANWGMLYKYVNQSGLTFGTAKEKGDLYYDCSVSDISAWRPGTWRHIAITWSRKQNARKIYLNGKLAAEAPFPYHRPVKNGPLFIGSGCTLYPGHVAHAKMDEVALWDQPLPLSAVTRLYQLGEQGKPLWQSAGPAGEETVDGQLNEVVPGTPLPRDAEEAPQIKGTLSLDGPWHVLPATGALAELPTKGWGTTQVPGYWTPHGATLDPDGKPARGTWHGRPVAEFRVAYYQRSFAVPVDWRGRSVVLQVGGVDGLGEIFLNGKRLAWLAGWEHESYEISALLRDGGKQNTLTLALHATGSANVGVFGSVSLQSMAEALVREPVVTTSVAKRKIGFSCDLWNPGSETNAELEFVIRPAKAPNEVTKRFTHRFSLAKSDRSKPQLSASSQRVACEFSWPDARLWTYDDPFLYRLNVRLRVAGKLIHEAPAVRFGFREFTVRGSDFLLNGVPTHLRGHQIDLGWSNQLERLQELKAAGMNCFEFSGPKSHSWYGAHVYRLKQFEEALDYADENGLIAIPILPGAKQLKDRIFEPEVAKLYRQRLDKHIRRYGNHPSICLWYMHFNLAGYRWYLAPTKIDGSHKPDNQPSQTKERYSVEAQRLAMQADSRPLYHHACGNFGDIFSMNCYIGPTSPLQEREEWPAHWAAKRPFPLVACEHGLLLVPYWFRPRKFPLSEVYADEPIFDELTAKYLGRRAYDMLTPEIFELYDTGREKPRGSRTRALVRQHPGYQEVKSLFAQHSLRSWRTYGVSGIIFNAINWDFKDSEDNPRPVMQALGRYFGDTDLFIAGPEGNWPSKDHAFVAREKIRKQAVLLNDLTRDLPVVLDWRLVDSQGKSHASGTIQGVAEAGKATKLAFACDAPDVKSRTEFRLAVSARAPQNTHFLPTTFAVEIFPRTQTAVGANGILLFDPVGDTTKILQQTGVTTQPLTRTSDLSAARLLVVGSQSYTDAFTTLSKQLNLNQAIRAGLSVLVFEQKTASPYGLELKEQSARRTFIASPGHPFLNGLRLRTSSICAARAPSRSPIPRPRPRPSRNGRSASSRWAIAAWSPPMSTTSHTSPPSCPSWSAASTSSIRRCWKRRSERDGSCSARSTSPRATAKIRSRPGSSTTCSPP